MGIWVEVTGGDDLERFQKMLDALSNPKHKEELLASLGSIVETQTKIRIADEKKAPDGTPWAAWSEGYARTRHGNQSPLVGEGDLRDSIQYVVEKIRFELGRHWFTQAYIKTVFQVRYKWMRTRALSLRPLVKRSSFRCISRWVRSPA